MHFPPWQVPAEQIVPSLLFILAGQLVLVPRQNSAASHSKELARHIVEEELNKSAGQLLFMPLQDSDISQTPAEFLQIEVDLESTGHDGPIPVHVSCKSHAPIDALHIVDEELNKSVGQLSELPEQTSTMSHIPVDALHIFPVEFASGGQVVELPLQNSVAPHAPDDALQIEELNLTSHFFVALHIPYEQA